MKRVFDAVVSAAVVIGRAPLYAVSALAITLDSRGPVLYRGARVGRGGVRFALLKFRTMVVDADRLGGSSTPEDDPRLTTVGRHLRKTKLDELPQFLNVLKGDMSIVGPRPQVEWAVARYDERERALLTVRPGITDWASIRFRDEGELLRGSSDPDGDYLRLIAPEKIRLGLEYVRRRSLWIDMQIIAATALAIVGVDPLWVFRSIDHRVDEHAG